jgi:hypothetical protein
LPNSEAAGKEKAMIRVARGVIFLVACAVAVAHGNDASAANVNVTLSLSGGMAPDPAIINVGDTVTFTCDTSCGLMCSWTELSGSIPGISPFSGTTPTATTSGSFGPATAAGSLEYQAIDSHTGCFDGSSTIIANPASFDPQPYLVYSTYSEDIDPDAMVDLQDQFGLKEEVAVTTRGHFMNPVVKQPIEPPGETEYDTDPALHYRWFLLAATPTGTKTVLVTDQFGDQVPWEIRDEPHYLLAPTSKLSGTGNPGPPPAGQHYSCYVIAETGFDPAATVLLSDQFDDHGPLAVGMAHWLCSPVEKTHDTVIFSTIPASDGRDHLACYELPLEGHDVTVSTRNQFTSAVADEVVARWDEYLCVPAIKTHPGFVTSVPSMRSGGIVALGLLMLLTAFWVVQRRVRYGKLA